MSTHIQWTDETWNPVAGCRKVSAGCDHCYAIRDAHRLAGNTNPKIADIYAGLTQVQNGRLNWTGAFHEVSDRLEQPLRWTRPRRIFVNSLSDLFYEEASIAFIWRVFAVMATCPQHQFQVLTKRPERMKAILDCNRDTALALLSHCVRRIPNESGGRPARADALQWPLPNVWLGTSVEDQKAADTRIPALLATPAAVRFLSCEPLLGPVRIPLGRCQSCHVLVWEDDLACPGCGQPAFLDRIHWVIAGGESGPGARPMDEEWLVDLALDCAEHGVALFVKQMGSVWARAYGARHSKGGDPEEWPAELRIREWPETIR